MPTITLRIKFDRQGHIGHGKVELLEHIAAFGSISAGARRINMSYKHAWGLVEEMNLIFGRPVLDTQKGGAHGGGAGLTPVGLALVTRYRAIQKAAEAAAAEQIEALQREIDVSD